MEKIKFYAYKYAPETARASVNGHQVDISGTAAPLYICTGQHDKAREEIKKAYRKQNNRESRFLYAFYEEGTRKFYYISALTFTASDDIKTRLRCFKILKETLQKNPPAVTIEAGKLTPNGATAPKATTQQIKIDFSKVAIIKAS